MNTNHISALLLMVAITTLSQGCAPLIVVGAGTAAVAANDRRTVNELRIAPPSLIGSRSHDTWLTTKVKTKMIQAENLDSSRVKVVTENDAVYLLGLVTQKEAGVATDAARSVQGVARVVKLFEYTD